MRGVEAMVLMLIRLACGQSSCQDETCGVDGNSMLPKMRNEVGGNLFFKQSLRMSKL